MAAALYPPPSRRWRLRFTIGGLLACTFVVGAGLARWRVPGATVPASLLSTLSAWLLVGHAGSLLERLRCAGQFRGLPKDMRRAVTFEIAFSLLAILACVVIIGAGLIRPPTPAGRGTNEILACFGVWLATGMLQRAAYSASRPIDLHRLSREARWGRRLEVAAPLGTILVLAVTGLATLFGEYERPEAWYEARASSVMIYLAFFLAIVCAYSNPRPTAADLYVHQPTRRRIGNGALLAVGALWGSVVLFHPGMLMALVHVAIRGVEAYQPTRWAARDFYPANFFVGVPVSFFVGGIAAAGLLLTATVACGFMIRSWHDRRARCVLASAAAVCATTIVALILWCRFQLLPEYSPILAMGVHEQSLNSLPLAAMLAMTVATAAATWLTATSQPNESPFAELNLPSKGFLHEHPAVVGIGLVGVLAQIALDISNSHWRFWDFRTNSLWAPIEEYVVDEPFKLVSLAVGIMLSRRLWAWWRGNTFPDARAWLVEPGRFAAAWIAAAIIFALLAPVAAWCGSAILLTLAMS